MGAHIQPPRPQRPRSGAWYRHALRLPPFVNGYLAVIVSPVNGTSTRDRRPDITVVAQATGGGVVDIQVEWRTAPIGPVVYTSTFIGAVSGTRQVVEPPAELTFANWYFRARAGDVSGNVWGAWTAFRYLTVYPLPGFAHAYTDFNIGVENIDPVRAISVYADLNVGLAPFDEHDGYSYVDYNVGLVEKPRIGAEYLELNVIPVLGAYEPATFMDINITTGTPTPHIWYVQPQIGPEGLMFRIVGQGFGVSQGEYDGKVMLGGLECPVVSWQSYPDSTSQVVRISRASMGTTFNVTYTLKPGGYSSPNAVSFAEGDTLEYEYRRLSPHDYQPDEQYWRPYFQITNGGSLLTPNLTDWNDQYGNIRDRPDVPVGEVITRVFAVPPVFWGSAYRGVIWGWMYAGSKLTDRPAHTVEIRNYVYRDAAGQPKLWIFGEDGSAITLPSGDVVITQGISPAFDDFIDYGATNKAHQEILVLVPDGAESGMVQVILEDF